MRTIRAIKIFLKVRKQPALFKLVSDIFSFIEKVANEGKPMMCKIANIDTSTGEKDVLVSLWAGIGDVNPIDRLGVLKTQNVALQDLLKRVMEDGNIDESLKNNIMIAITHFI